MGNSEERNPRSSSVRRSRSLSESIKGIFKGGNTSHNQHLNSPSDTPPLLSKKPSSRLGNIANNKEAELSCSRGAPVHAPVSPLQTPIISHRPPILSVPKLSKLSLSQNSQHSSSDNDHASPPLSEEEEVAKQFATSGGRSDEEQRGRDSSREGAPRLRHHESKSYSPDQVLIPEDGGLIDSLLENENKSNREETYSRRPRSNSSAVRSASLKRMSSTSSSASSSKGYPKSRIRADTFSASSLPRFNDLESKCIMQSDNFKVYENGFHEHNLKVTSLVSESSDGIDGSCKQKSGFSLSGIFKPNKEDKKLDNALSLIPTGVLSLSQRIDRARSQAMETNGGGIDEEDEESEEDLGNGKVENNRTPRIVNPNAAVGSEELKLINTLSEKIHSALNGKSIKNDGDERARDDPPTKFQDQYGKPIGVIGHGAYGVVKICSRPLTANDVEPYPTYSNGKRLYFAVKELRPKPSDQVEKFSTRITSEFIIGHSLSRCHKKGDVVAPNILKVIDLLEAQDAFVEVMEFCPSGDLYNLLTRKSKSGTALHPLEADCFMKQLLCGVQFMHSHGVAHCDLKPENILFHPDGLLKICDFGTSCVFQTAWEKQVHFQTGTMGSEPYVAPEEFIQGKEYDARLADCWSCGIVYCTMVLGHYLWKVALPGKDALYDSFISEMAEHKEFSVIEEMRHINNEINRLRRIALYQIFQIDPSKRITVSDLLQTAWMRRTKCCVFYRTADREMGKEKQPR